MTRLTAALPALVSLVLISPSVSAASAHPASQAAVSGSAADGPGAMSYLDLGRKDCLGTARNTTSRVWYTVAGGVLSDAI